MVSYGEASASIFVPVLISCLPMSGFCLNLARFPFLTTESQAPSHSLATKFRMVRPIFFITSGFVAFMILSRASRSLNILAFSAIMYCSAHE